MLSTIDDALNIAHTLQARGMKNSVQFKKSLIRELKRLGHTNDDIFTTLTQKFLWSVTKEMVEMVEEI